MSITRGSTACPQCGWEHAQEIWEHDRHDIICYRCGFVRHNHRGYGAARYTGADGFGAVVPLASREEVAEANEKLEAGLASGKIKAKGTYLTEVLPDGSVVALVGKLLEEFEG